MSSKKVYSKEFKLKVVNYYKNNLIAFSRTANFLNIPSSTTVREWVRIYNIHREKGFKKPIDNIMLKYNITKF